MLYAFIYRPSDGYIYDVGDADFEAIGTWDDARADECDIPMTDIGDMHFADFPALDAGTYLIQIRLRAGASPDTDDTPLSQGFIDWGGTSEITLFNLFNENQRVDVNVVSEPPVSHQRRIINI